LPVNEAIRWLQAQSSDDTASLLDYAEARFKQGGFRDAIAALKRARDLKPDDRSEQRITSLAQQIEAKAEPEAKQFLRNIRAGERGWIDGFLEYRDKFQYADAAREVMEAFQTLRAEQEPQAQKAFAEARTAFQQGRSADGRAKNQEIVDKYF